MNLGEDQQDLERHWQRHGTTPAGPRHKPIHALSGRAGAPHPATRLRGSHPDSRSLQCGKRGREVYRRPASRLAARAGNFVVRELGVKRCTSPPSPAHPSSLRPAPPARAVVGV